MSQRKKEMATCHLLSFLSYCCYQLNDDMLGASRKIPIRLMLFPLSNRHRHLTSQLVEFPRASARAGSPNPTGCLARWTGGNIVACPAEHARAEIAVNAGCRRASTAGKKLIPHWLQAGSSLAPWPRCDVCRRYARLKLAGLHDVDYRTKTLRLVDARAEP